MALTLFYITNEPKIAKIADMYGVDRIWIDLETLGKEERQKNMDTVKSHHTIADIRKIKPLLTNAEILVRINPWNEKSEDEINDVIEAGADIIMLPMWKSVEEVYNFISVINRRTKTSLLLETKEAVRCLDEVLKLDFDEIHVGLNDLHLSYGLTFMFELLANGMVEMLCNKFREKGIPYGFGGISRLGNGLIPAEKIIMEHYRLGSTRAILSRSFYDYMLTDNIDEIDRIFHTNMKLLREFELSLNYATESDYLVNKIEIARCVDKIVKNLKRAKSNECRIECCTSK